MLANVFPSHCFNTILLNFDHVPENSRLIPGISESSSLSTNLWLSHLCCSSSTVLTDNLIECSTVIGCYSPWFASQITQSTLNWNVQCYVNLAHVDLMVNFIDISTLQKSLIKFRVKCIETEVFLRVSEIIEGSKTKSKKYQKTV